MNLVLRAVAWLPHVAVTVLVLVAMVDMLAPTATSPGAR